VQSFTLWQQATIQINSHAHFLLLVRARYIWVLFRARYIWDHTNIIQKIHQRKKQNLPKFSKNGFENKVKFAYYKRYRNQLTHLLVLSKKEYYQSQFLIARNSIAKTWKLVNTLLPGRTKATSTPPNLIHPYLENARKILQI